MAAVRERKDLLEGCVKRYCELCGGPGRMRDCSYCPLGEAKEGP